MACDDIPEHNFAIYKGDDKVKYFRYIADSLPVDITSYVIKLECTLLSLTKIATITDALAGEFTFTFTPSDTVNLVENRVKYEVVFYPTGLTGDKFTKFKGSINLTNEVVV